MGNSSSSQRANDGDVDNPSGNNPSAVDQLQRHRQLAQAAQAQRQLNHDASARSSRSRNQPTRHPLLAPHSHQRPPPSSSQSAHSATMGHSQSRPAAPPPSAGEKPAVSPPPVKPTAGAQPAADPVSKKSDPLLPIGPPIPNLDEDSYLLPTAAAEFTRPPRLPLPIQGKVYTPGSPLISAADLTIPLGPLEAGFPALDGGDDLGTVRQGVLPSVSTIIEWREPGNKVYVTGTFADWDRKYRLTRGGPSKHKDALSATISLQPGTYHLRFIVDGDMVLSKHLPTAVDFTNSLVNYIEVQAKEAPATAVQHVVTSDGTAADPLVVPTPVAEYIAKEGVHPPLVLPPTPEIAPLQEPSAAQQAQQKLKASRFMSEPPKHYHSVIPQFFQDTDAPDNSEQFNRAIALTDSLPVPPSLPMFLNRSILNNNTPMKDDASVLVLPNHTVLNHLATSSIRNNVIATSATTRYKRKFLTTILYKPTDSDD